MKPGCIRSCTVFVALLLLALGPAFGSVTKVMLDNGMAVLVKEVPQIPVVALVSYIKVGSVDEPDSLAGISHFLEHMLFKGTEKRSAGDLSREVKSVGGYSNAGTGHGRTSHIVTLPSRYFDRGLEIQADALMHSVLDSLELARESKVVLEEVKMDLDEPESFLWDKLLNLAFTRHGYRRPILGYEESVSRIERKHMWQYYKNYYKPNNMVLAVAGDVSAEKAIAKIREVYRDFEEGEVQKVEPDPEPPQEAFRFGAYSGDLERTYLQLGFHIPEELHEDSHALEILSIIMGSGRSSRLYQKVKEEKGLVSDIWTYCFNGEYRGLFIIGATLDSENLEEAEVAILGELERLKGELVTGEELKKARAKVEASYERSRETVQGQAYYLGYYETVGDYRLADLYVENLYRVTRDDIRRVARQYLNLEGCTLVFRKPKGEEASQEKMVAEAVYSHLKARLPARPYAEERAEREVKKVALKNGITVLVKENPSVPLVSLGVYLRGGLRYENQGNNGITNFTQRVLTKGTRTRSQAELAEELESFGGTLHPITEGDYCGLTLSILSRHLKEGLEVLTDILSNPSFPADEVKKEREQILKEIGGRSDDLFNYTWDLFKKAVYKVHPYRRPLLGTEESVSSLSREDLVDWHRKWSWPKNTLISVVGDFDSDWLIENLENSLGRLKGREVKPPKIPRETQVTQKTVLTEELEKEQTHIFLGFLGPEASHEDYYPFRVLNAVLSGMGGRLYDYLREQRGLAYVVFSFLDSGVDPAGFGVYMGTSPDQEETAIKGILSELGRVKEEGLTEGELERAKRYLVGMHDIHLQRNSSQARSYAENEIFGLGHRAVEEFAHNIESVTEEQIDRVIDRYFDLENYSLAVVRGKSE